MKRVQWSVLIGLLALSLLNACGQWQEFAEMDCVLEKRRLDQALNAKEFAVLAGISYSAARAWFSSPGFPAFRGFVFWQDFVQWRNLQAGAGAAKAAVMEANVAQIQRHVRIGTNLPPRAAKLLAEMG